jgi:hypothetical protein
MFPDSPGISAYEVKPLKRMQHNYYRNTKCDCACLLHVCAQRQGMAIKHRLAVVQELQSGENSYPMVIDLE